MKKNLTKVSLLLSLLFVLVAASCSSYKKVPYLQNSDALEPHAMHHEPVIQPHDQLTIAVVSSQDQHAAMAFNLLVPTTNSTNSLTSQPALQKYIVDTKGCVAVPNVGELHLAGLTLPEAENLVLEKVKGAFAMPPSVTVRFADYKISVLGEVADPGTYVIANGKVNILQALSLAGDLTVYGQRDNVKIVREDENGVKSVHEINLNDAALLNSPNYYLQQNDVVYVTPNKAKSRNSDISTSTSLWFSGTSVVVSLVSLLFNILNK